VVEQRIEVAFSERRHAQAAAGTPARVLRAQQLQRARDVLVRDLVACLGARRTFERQPDDEERQRDERQPQCPRPSLRSELAVPSSAQSAIARSAMERVP
jgi:hypothetical protein